MSLKLGSNDTTLSAGSSVVKQMLLGSSPKFAAPVLDHVPNAAAAYSLRRLSNAYTGPVVKVRRSSDSTTADFTAAEVVDGTLTAWVGAGDGFVDTWYDQSGNARHATQATAGYQPKVVSSGVLVTEGGKPAVSFANSTSACLRAPFAASQPITVVSALRFPTASGVDIYDSYAGVGRMDAYVVSGQVYLYAGATGATGHFPDTASVSLFFAVYGGASSIASINGVAKICSAGVDSTDGITIGAKYTQSQGTDGTISEVIIYPSDVSASRELAEGEIAWHYGLQSKLPYNHAYAPQALGGASQTVPTDSDATAYLAAVAAADGSAVERSVAIAIDDFVKGLKADGLWSAIGSACVLAGARTVAGALVPLKGAAPTGYNWVASDYSRSLGLKGDGSTKYIDSNRAGNADGQNDTHHACYVSSLGAAGGGTYMGIGVAGNGAKCLGVNHNASGQITYRVNSGTGYNAGSSTDIGFIGASRQAAGTFAVRSASAYEQGVAIASTPTVSTTMHVFASNDGSWPLRVSARLSFYSIGASLDLALLDARVSALMSAIGAAL